MARGFVRKTKSFVFRSTLHSVLATTTAVAVVGGTIAGVTLVRHHGHNAGKHGGASGKQNGGGANGGGSGKAQGDVTKARLEGTWTIDAGTMSGTWTFTPACSKGACGGSSVRTADDFGAQGQPVDVSGTFTFSGGVYRGTENYTATCGNDVATPFDVPVGDVFQFAVSKATIVNGQLQATQIEGFTNHTAQIEQAGSSACGYNAGSVALTGHLAG